MHTQKNKPRLNLVFWGSLMVLYGIGAIGVLTPVTLYAWWSHHDRHTKVRSAGSWWERHHHRYPHENFIVINQHARYFRYMEHNHPRYRVFFEGPFKRGDPIFHTQVSVIIDRVYGRNYVESYAPIIEYRGGYIYYRYRVIKGGYVVVQTEDARWDKDFSANLWLE